MITEMEDVDGVKYVLGLESVIGSRVPEEILPDSVKSILESDRWELLLINSEYKVASDEVNEQIDKLNTILKKYDEKGMLIGEAPCMKDMIETTCKSQYNNVGLGQNNIVVFPTFLFCPNRFQ